MNAIVGVAPTAMIWEKPCSAFPVLRFGKMPPDHLVPSHDLAKIASGGAAPPLASAQVAQGTPFTTAKLNFSPSRSTFMAFESNAVQSDPMRDHDVPSAVD